MKAVFIANIKTARKTTTYIGLTLRPALIEINLCTGSGKGRSKFYKIFHIYIFDKSSHFLGQIVLYNMFLFFNRVNITKLL